MTATESCPAKGVIGRITPGLTDRFRLQRLPADGGSDVFEIESIGDHIVLRGSNGVALASAFHRYLKETCKCHVSWCGDQLNLPDPLPQVPAPVRVTCLHRHRVYFNYCTISYTASWWDWARWEREIDLMALNGINMPLAPVGLEAVWYHALLKIGFTDLEARTFLVGPCYSAWQWMTNIEGQGGPLPREWIDSRIALGRMILQRQRALGMTPIQQGFTGFVPRLFKTKFPGAALSTERPWCGFEGTCQLDPLDPLFRMFGRIFLETQTELFGTSHLYAVDPFHEGKPPVEGDDYQEKVGKEIWNLLQEVDPEATGVMQAWSIRKPIATQFPKDRLVVLDLAGQRDDFWGYDFVKGQLHNFGGRINLHGDLRAVATNPFAKAAASHKHCVGMGLFMEGIEQNPVFYDMVFDMIWRDKPVKPDTWLHAYAERRYGGESENARKAWRILLAGPYKSGTNGVEASSIFAARPALKPLKSGPNAGFEMPYRPKELIRAWRLLLRAADDLGDSDAYRFDLMDTGRQVLSNLGQQLVREAARAFAERNAEAFKKRSGRYLELLADVDRLLATRNEYSFDRWIRSARAWGQTGKLRSYYEWNASMLVTLWGPVEDPRIFDYAWREWAGLIRLYYLPRWQMFYSHLASLLARGETYSDPEELVYGRHALRSNDFYASLADWEQGWIRQTHTVLEQPVGDTVAIACELEQKYRKELAGSTRPGTQQERDARYDNLGCVEKAGTE